MPRLLEYLTADGLSPFGRWFRALDPMARARVSRAMTRLEAGNAGDWRAVGHGVMELRIHVGPGYRVYYGWDGDEVILLLGGGTKQRQGSAIAMARDRWDDYKRRKRTGA
jgi:putative addiction module killer protein